MLYKQKCLDCGSEFESTKKLKSCPECFGDMSEDLNSDNYDVDDIRHLGHPDNCQDSSCPCQGDGPDD